MLDVERKVLKEIDEDTIVKTTNELIQIPSVTGDESNAQRHISKLMRDIGLQTDVWEIDISEIRKHPDFSMGVDRKEGLGVVGRLSRGRGCSLILNGHIDVVSPGDESNWTHPPWMGTRVSGMLYGRGSVDMKGGLSCALHAVKAVIDSGVNFRGDVFVESVVGEEDGGIGALATVLRGYKTDGAVIMEPTELKVAPAQAGSHCFKITVKGRSAHACVREEGVSALEKFMPIYQALITLERSRNSSVDDPLYSRYQLPIPLNLGVVKCGNWPSSVPEELVLEGRYGIGVDEDVASAHLAFEKAVADATASDDWLLSHPPLVEWRGGQFNPARTPTEHHLTTTVAGAYRDVAGVTPIYEGVTYGSDMRHLVNVGKIPTILFGPGDVRLCHRPDEHVPIRDLVIATRTLALTILRFCHGP
jgi:acetylornithine deacetylase